MDRTKEQKKIPLRTNMLAFQLGESAEIHTGGFLEATPHCVVRSDEIAGKKISRNTFALFMQPNHLEPMTIPEGVSEGMITEKEEHEKVTPISKRWENGITFKEFTNRTLAHYA
jgi:isopenicillin N synthase-like dioxygenase